MELPFYRAFEEKYRVPRELIKSRLVVYESFVERLKVGCIGGRVVDLGYGCSEWLEIVSELGFDGEGIDLQEDMFSACRELGLNVERQEAIAYLKTLPESSAAIVSGFHVTTHIPFSELQILVQEALRVLLPGGLLILETPNPENIVVCMRHFYLSPTHHQPIPSQLLSFLPEYYGFSRIKTIRLQESTDLIQNTSLASPNVLEGVSPDYAVIAQKAVNEKIIKAVDAAFAVEYGVGLGTLATRYQAQLETTAQQATERAAQAEAHAAAAQAALEATRKELSDVHQANHYNWQRAEECQQQIQTLLNSVSWRITSSLRWLDSTVRGLKLNALKPRKKLVLGQVALYIGRRPRLKKVALSVLNRFPGLQSRSIQITTGTATLPVQPQSVPIAATRLSPRARQIYTDLKVAIERQQRDQT